MSILSLLLNAVSLFESSSIARSNLFGGIIIFSSFSYDYYSSVTQLWLVNNVQRMHFYQG